jgi:hypothetical protein
MHIECILRIDVTLQETLITIYQKKHHDIQSAVTEVPIASVLNLAFLGPPTAEMIS